MACTLWTACTIATIATEWTAPVAHPATTRLTLVAEAVDEAVGNYRDAVRRMARAAVRAEEEVLRSAKRGNPHTDIAHLAARVAECAAYLASERSKLLECMGCALGHAAPLQLQRLVDAATALEVAS